MGRPFAIILGFFVGTLFAIPILIALAQSELLFMFDKSNRTLNLQQTKIVNISNLGIGTTEPGAKLSVVSPDAAPASGNEGIRLQPSSIISGSTLLNFGINDTANYAWIRTVENGVNEGILSLQPIGGLIGIGTTAPLDKLTVSADNTVIALGESGGANLLYNGGAEDGISGWTSRDFAYDASAGSGNISGTALAGSLSFSASNDGGLNQAIEVVPSSVYTVTLRMRTDYQGGADGSQGRIVVGTTATNRDIVDKTCNPDTYDITPNTNKWVFCSATFTAPAATDLKTTMIYVGFRAEGNTHTVLVDNVMLSRGGIPQAYNPLTTFIGSNGATAITGNVGIGTAKPIAKLHIADARPTLRLEDTTTGEKDYELVANGSGFSIDEAWVATRFLIDTNGNVGIGTTTPQRELHVVAASGYAELRLAGASGSSGSLEFYDGTTNRGDIYIDPSSDMHFRNTAESLTIKSGGNIGIGTTAPGFKLDVNGTFKLGGDIGGRSFMEYGTWTWNYTNGDSYDKWIKIGELVLEGYAWSDAGVVWNIYPTNSNHGDSVETIAINFRNNDVDVESTYNIDHTILGGNEFSIKDVKVVRRAGTGLGPNSLSVWAQASASWLASIQWTAFTKGNVILNRGLQTQYTAIPDTGTTYDTTGLYVMRAGSFGIGTVWPRNKLVVTADSVPVGDYDTAGQFAVRGSTNNDNVVVLGYDTTNNYGWIQPSTDWVAWRNLALNPGGGNVGIGTTAPMAKLQVNGQFLLQDFKTAEVSQSGTGDLTIPLGRYRIGTGITLQVQIEGGWAEGGGIYHIGGSWGILPTVSLRSESAISQRLKFYGKLDGNGYVWLTATWDNVSPGEASSNTPRFLITGYDFDTANTTAFIGFTELVTRLEINNSSGNVGIGTTAPGYKLDVVGDINLTGALRVNGTQFSGGQWITSASNIYYNSGNVGIGTTAPEGVLNVSRNTAGSIWTLIDNTNSTANNEAQLRLNPGNGLWLVRAIENTTGANDTNLRFTLNGVVNAVEIASSGNVGIGTTAPASKLEVWGTAIDALRIVRTDASSQYVIYGPDGSLDVIGGNPHRFKIAGSEKMRVDTNGNVGIGTTAPDYQLHLAKNTNGAVNFIDISGNDTNGDGGSGLILSDNNIGQWTIFQRNKAPANALHFAIGEGGTVENAKMTILQDGNVGIGTINPLGILDIRGVTPANKHNPQLILRDMTTQAAGVGGFINFGGLYNGTQYTEWAGAGGVKETSIAGNYAGALVLYTRSNGSAMAERVRINSSGNVGIGTTMPKVKLEINDGAIEMNSMNLPGNPGAKGMRLFVETGQFGCVLGSTRTRLQARIANADGVVSAIMLGQSDCTDVPSPD